MTLVCTSCEEDIENETQWDDVGQLCLACFELGGSPTYCCGAIYEGGEDVCASCGEPL